MAILSSSAAVLSQSNRLVDREREAGIHPAKAAGEIDCRIESQPAAALATSFPNR